MLRKNSKRLLAALLAVGLLVGLLPMLVFAEDNITWQVEDGVLYINGQGAMPSYTEGGAPWSNQAESITSIMINYPAYGGEKVNYIGDYAFAGLYNVTSISERSIGVITGYGKYACSGCTKLEEIRLGTGVTTIGEGAFYNCGSLRFVRIPGGVSNIGSYAFYGTPLGVQPYDPNNGCGVYYEGTAVMWSNVTVGEGNEPLLNGIKKTFAGFEWNIYGGMLMITGYGEIPSYAEGGAPWSDRANEITEISIQEGITAVGDYAFAGLNKVTTISYLPTSLRSIGKYAFKDCSGFTWCLIPDGVTTIGEGAFYGCTKMVSFDIPISVTRIDKFAFTNTKLLYGNYYGSSAKWKTITIGEGNEKLTGTSITFRDDDLTYTVAGDTLTISGTGDMRTFSDTNCPWYSESENIKRLVIEEGVTSISTLAFGSDWHGCPNLESVSLPDSLTTIEQWAFAKTKLTEVTIPKGVTDIGGYAFEGCYSLTRFTVDPENTVYSNDAAGALLNKDQTVLEAIPAGMTGTYTIPETVTTIETAALYGGPGLKEVVVTKNVKTYLVGALTGMGAESLVFQEGMIELPESFLCESNSVKSVTIPKSLTSIPRMAFEFCENLTDVYYGGTEEQWKQVTIGDGNDYLLNATIHYTTPATEPTTPAEPTTPSEPTAPVEPTEPGKPTEPSKPTDSTSPTVPDNKVNVEVNTPTHDTDKKDETTIGASQSNAEKVLTETLDKIVELIKEKTEEAAKNLESILPKELIEVITQVADDTSNLEIVSSVDVSTIDPSSELNEETKQDIEKIHQEGGNAKIAQYMDLSVVLTAYVNGEEAASGAVSELSDKLEFTVSLSDDLKTVPGGYKRTYFVIRVHNGEVTRLPANVNQDGTITFATDKFSTYALAYEDTAVPLNTPATGDSADLTLWYTMFLGSGVCLVTMLLCDRKKKYVGKYLN